MLKVHIGKPYTIEPQEMELFYSAMVHHVRDLETLRGWIDKDYPNENARKNIDEEIAARQKIVMHLYENHFGASLVSEAVEYVEATRATPPAAIKAQEKD